MHSFLQCSQSLNGDFGGYIFLTRNNTFCCPIPDCRGLFQTLIDKLACMRDVFGFDLFMPS